ncbi:MAG: DUF2141 domain-containing protein [Deltaproteobacteria bacterium]|nr:DUF2141 domain-containing protein [Deltaproteobacteria bacterium]
MARSLTWSALFALVVALALPLASGPAAITTAVAQDVSAVPVTAQTGRRVVVVIENLRSGRGQVLGGLYTNPRVWLREGHAAADCTAPIRAGRAECVFENVTTPRFAFAGMHDEDSDRELDRDALGLPQEGYAFSNDAREPFGPPSFAAAAFQRDRLVVHARYGL